MVSHVNSHPELWPHERRVGYEDRRTVAYAGDTTSIGRRFHWVDWEVRLGSLMAAVGLMWGAHVLAANGFSLDVLRQAPGPLQICGIGLLIWLHAKWQRSVKLR